MHIVSINLGQPETLTYFDRPVQTGGRKTPVPGALLRRANFEGDGQADLKNHGGPDKAVCVYSFDHYPYWEQTLGAKLAPGAFSENLTIAGLREADVCLGDVFEIGEARVQISQPRQPCSKLAGKHQRKDLPELIHANSFSGFYFRVLREGLVRAGEAVMLVEPHPARVSIQFINELLYRQRTARADFERALNVEALAEACRASILKRL